ncbi:MAG: hypothetical protein J6Z31_07635 [Fibrobacter sp.]|nr:hypothetical protein [Fibrobacter sp.]
MAEENKIQDSEILSTTPAPDASKEIQPEILTAEAPKEEAKPAEKPQVIVKKERGLSHYVGLALLTVLSIIFFFIPGVALVYLVSCIAAITAPVAWIFAAILSVVVWFIFKLKIKGFKKSFFWYIGLCALISILLVSLSVFTSYHVLSGIFALLIGGSN